MYQTLPYPGAMGDQPAYVFEAIRKCEDVSAQITNRRHEAELKRLQSQTK